MENLSIAEGGGLPVVVFTDEAHDSTFHFQIIKLTDQLYIWIGCNSGRLGHMFASFPVSFDKMPSTSSLIGGGPDNTGASLARRLALITGWSVVLAANLPPNSPLLEAFAEQRLLQELRRVGYVKTCNKPPQ